MEAIIELRLPPRKRQPQAFPARWLADSNLLGLDADLRESWPNFLALS
jgi:hypothetical protein